MAVDGLRDEGRSGGAQSGESLHGGGLPGEGLPGEGLHGEGLPGGGLHGEGLHGDGLHGEGLRVDGLSAGYGAVRVLRCVSLTAPAGAVTCIMGRNGAGKSTLLKAVMGLVPASEGSVKVGGVAVQGLPAHRVPGHGIAYVPQGRRLFGPLTVAENLSVGLLLRGRPGTCDRVLDLFPRLRERLGQTAATLSGGEQQMLAIARALCLEPSVLLLDEPTEGLQPSMIALIREVVLRLAGQGVAVVLVEQRVEAVLRMATTVAFMAQGQVEDVVPAAGLTAAAPQFRAFVGV